MREFTIGFVSLLVAILALFGGFYVIGSLSDDSWLAPPLGILAIFFGVIFLLRFLGSVITIVDDI